MAQLVLEGTWEEIARQAARFAGKRVRLTVLGDEEQEAPARNTPLSMTATPEELIRALDQLAEQNRHLPVLPPEAFERESLYEGHY